MKRKSILFLFILYAATLPSCNIFDPFDKPSTDEQYLDQARACFDEGDYDCAKEYYGKLATDNDVRNAEEAFMILDQAGLGMGAFMSAMSGGKVSEGINKLAAGIGSTPGSALALARRNAIYGAYNKWKFIKNSGLQGLVRFITSISLLAEMLGEAAGNDGQLRANEISVDGATCKAADGTTCGTTAAAACSTVSASSALNDDTTVIAAFATTSSAPGGIATLPMVYQTIVEISNGISTIGASGKFGGTSFSGVITELAAYSGALNDGTGVGTAARQCFRRLILSQGIGAE